MTDIRIDVAMPNNPKTKRLIRIIGDHGFSSLIRLWCFAGEYRQDGILSEMSDADIEDAAGWRGDNNMFVSTLEDEKWLDKNGNGEYSLHDWPDNQPWIVGAKKRSQIARENAAKAWVTRRGGKPPAKEKESKTNALEDFLPIKEIIEYLNVKSGKSFSHTSRTTKSHVAARWKEGFGLEEFRRVIDYQCAKWIGDPKMEEYLRPVTLFGTKFESYLNAPPVEATRGATDTAGRALTNLEGDVPF